MLSFQDPDIKTVGKENPFQTVMNNISSFCREDKHLMISIFDLKKKKFLFCNDSFKATLGYEIEEIIMGGWDFWFEKIDLAEVKIIKHTFSVFFQKPDSEHHPGWLSVTYHVHDIFGIRHFVSHELSLFQFKKSFFILNYLYDISRIEQIEYLLGKKQRPFAAGNVSQFIISKREKEVLLLIAEGFSSKQIADELYISNHTAIKHRKNLIEKFKVKNTAQLVKEASRFFLL